MLIIEEETSTTIWLDQTDQSLTDNSWLVVLRDGGSRHDPVARIESFINRKDLGRKLRLDSQFFFIANSRLYEAYRS